MLASKDAVADSLAQAHYTVDPGIRLIIRLLGTARQEADPNEPIKLLEINENAVGAGIYPIFFGPHPQSGISFSSVIVDVTPDEWEEIRRKPELLPDNWQIGPEMARLAPAGAES